jgi:hypothetical protein
MIQTLIQIPEEYIDNVFEDQEVIKLKERIISLNGDPSLTEIMNDLMSEYGVLIMDKTINVNSINNVK